MKGTWGVVVVGLCALVACAPENDIPEQLELTGGQPPASPIVRLRVEPGAVTFPRSFVGQTSSASVRLRNAGEALAAVELRVPAPFTLKSTALNLPPGAEHMVELRLTPTAPGTTGGVLSVRSGGRTLELTVRAEVEPAPPGPQGLPSEECASSPCSGPDGTAR